MRILLFLVFLYLFSFSAQGQTLDQFSKKPGEFFKQAEKALKKVGRDEAEEVGEQFMSLYEQGSFDEKQIEDIIIIAKKMAARDMRAYPSFEYFVEAVVSHQENIGNAQRFGKWIDITGKVADNQDRGRNLAFKEFVKFSKDLFANRYIYTSRSKNWSIQTSEYTFHYKDEKPFLEVPETKLTGFSSRDTIYILQTKGAYYPLTNKWEGQQGTVDWNTAGLQSGTVTASFSNYEIKTTNSSYEVDSAQFSYPKFFDKKLIGKFKDKMSAYSDESRITYPRFYSYEKTLLLEEIDEHLDYKGGFAIEGNKILGTGTDEQKATLTFHLSDGQQVMEARSKKVRIELPNEVSAEDAQIDISLGNDSIYHPGARLQYRMDKQELSLYRGKGSVSSTYFYDSFHNHQITADKLTWNLDSAKIRIEQIGQTGASPVEFKSDNYFRKGELQQYQGMLSYNPVMVLQRMIQERGSREFYAETIAKEMNPNYSEQTIKKMLYRLQGAGFITYDEATGVVKIRSKTITHVMASKGYIDYDIIRFESREGGTNAELDLNDYDIDVNGVENVLISDSNFVVLFPRKKELTIKKNRDMAFSGKVLAGRVDFVGEGFHFDYDSFSIDLTNLAAAIINVPSEEENKDGSPKLVPLKSKIEGLTGYLNIDKPNNKSGRKQFPRYPIFHNEKNSYVYYEYDFIYDSAYTKEDFYFELDPFTFDSLQTFDPYLSDFKGRMVSADIFPTFEEELKIQDDLSLGFQRTTPTDGYPLYQDKGTFTDSIFLSNKGFRGKGTIEYRFVTIESDQILFFPDSLNTITDSFNMKQTEFEGETYPRVTGVDNDIHWRPYQDSMFIEQRSEPFSMYDVNANLEGNLVLTDNGLRGGGSFQWKEAALASNNFDFKGNQLQSDSMSMEILSINKEKVTFNTPDVSGNVNFEKNIGQFKSNREDIATTFDDNQYKTAINEFTWDIDKNVLDFQSPPGSKGAYFVSTHPDQDSLKFRGKRAFFDLPTSVLEVYDIPYIPVADSRIHPDSSKVVIESNANMKTLENAEVITDTASEYHRLYEATLDIEGAKRFHGSGKYDYTMRNGRNQTFMFDTVGVRRIEDNKLLGKTVSHETYAHGTINEDDSLFINPRFLFKGDVKMKADRKHLAFNGFSKLALKSRDTTPIPTTWFGFHDTINPEDFVLNYGAPLNPDGDTLFTGFTYDQSSIDGLSASVMENNTSPSALTVLKTDGIVKYRHQKGEFVFGDQEKIINGAPRGNILRYSDVNQEAYGEGDLDLHLNLKPLTVKSAGSITQKMDKDKVTLNLLLGLDLNIDKDLIATMAEDLNSFTYDNKQVTYNSDKFHNAYAEVVKDNKVDKAIETLNKTGTFERPKSMEQTIIFSDLKMKYDSRTQTYQSTDRPGLSFVGDKAIHKHIRGFVEFGKRRTSDFFNIYFESVAGDWYFLTYKNDVLQVLSSNEKFNKQLSGIKPKNRKTKIGKERFFIYSIATFRDKSSFVQRMRNGGQPPAIDQKEPENPQKPEKPDTKPDQQKKQPPPRPSSPSKKQQQPPSQQNSEFEQSKPSYDKDEIGVPGQRKKPPKKNDQDKKGDKQKEPPPRKKKKPGQQAEEQTDSSNEEKTEDAKENDN